MMQAPPLPKAFSVQAHLYNLHQEATLELKKATDQYARFVTSRILRIQNVARSVLAKELGVMPYSLNHTHVPYLPPRLRWVLRYWQVQPSPRDVTLTLQSAPGGRVEKAVIPQDMLTLSDRDVAKLVRTETSAQKLHKVEALRAEARFLNQKRRKEADSQVYRLEAMLAQAKKEVSRMGEA